MGKVQVLAQVLELAWDCLRVLGQVPCKVLGQQPERRLAQQPEGLHPQPHHLPEGPRQGTGWPSPSSAAHDTICQAATTSSPIAAFLEGSSHDVHDIMLAIDESMWVQDIKGAAS